YVAKCLQLLETRPDDRSILVSEQQYADAPASRGLLLRTNSDRRYSCRAKKRDELPPPHSITSSAWARTNIHGPSPPAGAGCRAWKDKPRTPQHGPCRRLPPTHR